VPLHQAGGQVGVSGVDAVDGVPPGRRRHQQLGPSVGRVRVVLGQAPVDEEIGDALHALPGDAHDPGDLGHGERFVQHGAQDLPPGGGEADRAGELLGHRQHLPVQAEDRQRHTAQQLLGRRVGSGAGHADTEAASS
jgi:hypothetical protein